MQLITLIHEIESLVNSIASRPREFEKKISEIRMAREKFRETETYASEAVEAAVESGVCFAAGAACGAAAASIASSAATAHMAPSAAMWAAAAELKMQGI